MAAIKIYSSTSHAAAAVMAKTMAGASEPWEQDLLPCKRTKAEKTRPRNPNRLTLDQHVFPLKSIDRFVAEDGRVSARLLRRRGKNIRVKPTNSIFCARRAWDQRAETGYMKHIEDDFQEVVTPIIEGRTATVPVDCKQAIDRMYALWYWRTRMRYLESQEVQLNGVDGSELNLEQEENLESNGYLFPRKGGAMPARQINGAILEMRIDHQTRHLDETVPRWGVITTQAGEFVVPDVPAHQILPLAPRLTLAHSSPDGMITEQNVAQINSAMRAQSQDYIFALDFSACPF